MARVRYRKVSAAGAPSPTQQVAGDHGRSGSPLEPEGMIPLEDVERLVVAGTLRASDEVDLGRGWERVSEAPELADAFDRHRSIQATQTLLKAFIVVTIVGIIAAGFALWFNLNRG